MADEVKEETDDNTGPRPPKEQIVKELNEELMQWQLAGLDPDNIVVPSFQTATKLQALTEYLIRMGVIDRDEIEDFSAVLFTQRLREIREPIKAQQIKAMLTHDIKLPPGVKGL